MGAVGARKIGIVVVVIMAAVVLVSVAWFLTDRNDVGPRFSSADDVPDPVIVTEPDEAVPDVEPVKSDDFMKVAAGEKATALSIYTDLNGDTAFIPAEFTVSSQSDEQTVNTGLVVVGPDGSEFVWIPTTVTELGARDFGVFFSNGDKMSNYHDETDLQEYKDMVEGV